MYAELVDKVVVISGAAGGLGTAVVKRFQVEGTRLVLIDRNEAALQTLSERLGLKVETTLTGVVDITQPAEIATFLDKAVTQFDSLDVLVNIAGGFVYSGPVHEMDMAQLDSMLEVNTRTAFLLSAAAAKRMVTVGKGGRIINIGTRGALSGAAGMSAYAASKSAVLRLTESMAAELLDKNITVNAVLPSTIDTAANRKSMPDADFHKWVSPESLADVIAFLASDAARDISGASLPVYGKS